MNQLYFLKRHLQALLLKSLFFLFILSALPVLGSPALPGPEVIGLQPALGLKPVYKGAYLSLYTSGRLMRQKRHPKSGVWNTPARMLEEMWVKRTEEEELIRLDPQNFRQQLVELLADFPEVHGAIRHRSFTYKKLDAEIPNLNDYIDRVILIRREREQFDDERQLPARKVIGEEGEPQR